jgi:hypothetical protein
MTLVEIEKSSIILPAMVYRTPIWCFVVYEIGHNAFSSWMGDGPLGRTVVRIGSLTINNIVYINAADTTDPMTLQPNHFCQIENTVYVRTENDNPLWVYYQPKYNAILGLTDGEAREVDGVFYKGGLNYVPKVNDEADNLEYGRMKFANENIGLTNTKGEYDAVTRYFGNNIRVKSEINGEIKKLYEYYIKNVKIKEDVTTFVCGDRREKLKQKVPSRRFTLEEYPYMKPELEGQIKQDVYGECEWVKCVCVDELKIYVGENGSGGIKKYRRFYVARKITKLHLEDRRDPDNHPQQLPNYVWIKQTQPDSISYEDPTMEAPWSGEKWTPCPIDLANSDLANGIIAVNIIHCMPPLWEGHDVPEVYEVRACGIFWAPNNTGARPLDIIKELLRHYCSIPYDQYWFNRDEIQDEIGGLAPIGIVFDKEIGVFEAIEKLQNASDYGFRFMADYNRFTARKDDNERKAVGTIKITDIVDIGKAELDMQIENYATIVDIAYKRNYYHDTASHYEGRANQEALMNVHGIEKIYEPETYLTKPEHAKNKADRLEAFFRKNRIMIKNLEVLNWPSLRVYDIVRVDLRIPRERKNELKQVAVLFDDSGYKERSMTKENVVFGDWPSEKIIMDFGEEEEPADRYFGGELTCKVMSVGLDIDTMTNTLSLLEVGNDA